MLEKFYRLGEYRPVPLCGNTSARKVRAGLRGVLTRTVVRSGMTQAATDDSGDVPFGLALVSSRTS